MRVIVKGGRRQWRKYETKIKTILEFLQIATAMPFNMSVQYPETYDRMMTTLAIVQFDFVPDLGLSCWRKNGFDYCDKLLATTLT